MSKKKEIISIGNEQILQLAKVQNKERLYSKFPNIEHITGKMIDGKKRLTIYVNDDDILKIPKTVTVKLNEHVSQRIKTNILPSISKELILNSFIPAPVSVPLEAQLKYTIYEQTTVWNKGSICCMAEHDYQNNDGSTIKVLCAVTSGHIFTEKNFYIVNGFRNLSAKGGDAISNGYAIGKNWFLNIDHKMDIAAVVLNLKQIPDDFKYFRRFNNTFYQIDSSSRGESVTVLSGFNGGKTIHAQILNECADITIYYENSPDNGTIIHNVILIGRIQNGQSVNVSQGGDSGGCVYHTRTNSLIGLILGQDKQSTFVLPVESVLSENKFTVL